ncbi:MAG: DUF2851 family protein [Candidatus Marinimicrobia bacterium]|jgi:hypothetical protein|nr:DUF2851 family protein [Candidatus Neomarinimicrobiota bacterium]MBT3997307.1 DUF2851 family protein [Candidatus Neomarinimicrobiota bacterium]
MYYPVELQRSLCISDSGFQSERSLEQAWFALLPGTTIITSTGDHLTLINHGILNRNEGPDVLNARLLIHGSIQQGNVEFHLKAEDWFYHGHQHNPKYDHILLHVLGNQSNGIALLPGCVAILEVPQSKKPDCTLRNAVGDPGKVLSNFAQIRWSELVQSFCKNRNNSNDWRRLLLVSSFKMLGKGGNEDSFVCLANRIDFEIFERFKQSYFKMPWKVLGMRPSHRPKKRVELAEALVHFISKWSDEYWSDPKQYFRTMKTALSDVSGSGIRAELMANVFFPAMAAEAIYEGKFVGLSYWKSEWMVLTLPYSYGKYSKRFSHVLSSKQLKSIKVLQGLKKMDEEFCHPRHCIVCPLKKHDCLDAS